MVLMLNFPLPGLQYADLLGALRVCPGGDLGNPLEMEVPMGKSRINSVFSIAMFDYRRVFL